MNTFSILQSAEITGGGGELSSLKSINNRDQLNAKLRASKRIVAIGIGGLFVVVLVIVVVAVVIALMRPENLTKGLLPYLGGGGFLALLEFERRLIREYTLVVLSLDVAEHSDDDGFARYIEAALRTTPSSRTTTTGRPPAVRGKAAKT